MSQYSSKNSIKGLNLEKLTEESKAIIERFKIHSGRCVELQLRLGKGTARAFHVKWKGDPDSPVAAKEFALLMSGN